MGVAALHPGNCSPWTEGKKGEFVRGGRALHSGVCLWTGLLVLRAEEGAEGNGVGKKPKDKNLCFKAYIALGGWWDSDPIEFLICFSELSLVKICPFWPPNSTWFCPKHPRFLSDFISALSFLLHWRLSLVGTSEGPLSFCGSQASHCGGLSCCGAQALGRVGSVVVAQGPSCPAACGILPDQGSNWPPLHCKGDS